MKEHIHIIPLGGLDENGKNLTIVQINDDIFVIDCGALHADKATPGVDFVIADYTYLKEHKDQIRAYIITHAHDDQFGALPIIFKDCPAPIYCTELTKMFITSYTQFYQFDVDYDFHIVKSTENLIIANRNFHLFTTCHSVPFSFGVAIETDLGNIVYTGDFIISNNNTANFTYDSAAAGAIAEKPTLLLIMESLFAGRGGYTSPNHLLAPLISPIFDNTDGRIIASIYSTNIFAISQIIEMAIKHNRKICAYDKNTDLYLNNLFASVPSLCPLSSYLKHEDVNRVTDDKIVILILGFSSIVFKKINEFANNGSDLIKIKPNDAFIFSSPPSLRTEVEATRTLDNLYRTNIEVVNFSRNQWVSMHPSDEDIKTMIALFKPKYYLPIKGSFRKMLANANVALSTGGKLTHRNIFLLENGGVLDIDETGARILTNGQDVKCGSLYVDGLNLATSSSNIIEERVKLGEDGIVVLSFVVDLNQHRTLGNIEIEFLGVTCSKDIKTVKRNTSNEMIKILDELLLGNNSIEQIKAQCYENLARVVKKETLKEPLLLIQISSL